MTHITTNELCNDQLWCVWWSWTPWSGARRHHLQTMSVLTHLLDPEQTFLFGGQTIPLSLAAVITNERRCNRLLRKCFYIPHKGLSAGLVLSCMFSVEQWTGTIDTIYLHDIIMVYRNQWLLLFIKNIFFLLIFLSRLFLFNFKLIS